MRSPRFGKKAGKAEWKDVTAYCSNCGKPIPMRIPVMPGEPARIPTSIVCGTCGAPTADERTRGHWTRYGEPARYKKPEEQPKVPPRPKTVATTVALSVVIAIVVFVVVWVIINNVIGATGGGGGGSGSGILTVEIQYQGPGGWATSTGTITVSNGRITAPNNLSGSINMTTGEARFTGPCPIAHSPSVEYTGNINQNLNEFHCVGAEDVPGYWRVTSIS